MMVILLILFFKIFFHFTFSLFFLFLLKSTIIFLIKSKSQINSLFIDYSLIHFEIGGWIHHLLHEAENERMHLLTWMKYVVNLEFWVSSLLIQFLCTCLCFFTCTLVLNIFFKSNYPTIWWLLIRICQPTFLERLLVTTVQVNIIPFITLSSPLSLFSNFFFILLFKSVNIFVFCF